MIELVFVIVVIGILASVALPRIDDDKKQESMDNVLSDIRYTQQLALSGSKQMFDKEKWQQRYWRIIFSSCNNNTEWFYMIGTDNNMTDSTNAFFSKEEAATDSANGKPMFYNCSGVNKTDVSKRIFLSDNYGIKSVATSTKCDGNGGKYIGFDHMGRPHYGFSQSSEPDYASYMTGECIITFTFTDDSTSKIHIAPETGHAYIDGQPNS